MLLATPSRTPSSVGAQGPPGAQGLPGIGIQGPQGPTGVGTQGFQGVPGVGVQGPQGATAVGAQGNQGPQGVAGTSPAAIVEGTATPTLTLIQPAADWSITQQGCRITRIGSIAALQSEFVIEGTTIYNGTTIEVEFVALKADVGTPIPLDSPGNILTNGRGTIDDEASVVLQSQDATTVTYRCILTITPPLAANTPFTFGFSGTWYTQ